MKAQQPAEGILKRSDFGDSKFYSVACSCGNDDDAIEFEVEADDIGITVTTWTTQKTNFWEEHVSPRYDIDDPWHQEFNWATTNMWNGFVRRCKLTWDIWFKGYVKYQSTTIMTEQQALNYAETINTAIRDVKFFREERKWKDDLQNRIASKLAKESDCV